MKPLLGPLACFVWMLGFGACSAADLENGIYARTVEGDGLRVTPNAGASLTKSTPSGTTVERYRVRGFPTAMVVGRNGKIALNTCNRLDQCAPKPAGFRRRNFSVSLP